MTIAFCTQDMEDTLKCYVAGSKTDDNAKNGIISFAVPEYGIIFRCGVEATLTDLNIIAFLTFLRFAEHNKDIFKKRELHIFTDFPLLVYLMNDGSASGKGLGAVRKQAQKYARGFLFKVKWINRPDNRAAQPVNAIPTLPAHSNLKIKSFIEVDSGKKSDKSGNLFESQ